MDEIKSFRSTFLKTCHHETHEMIVNAERAYSEGKITLEQKWDAVKAAIASETEWEVLGKERVKK